MSTYRVTVWASYDTEVEADTQEEAEEKAVDEAPFSHADYCDTVEVE